MATKQDNRQQDESGEVEFVPIEPSMALILAKYNVPVISTPDEIAAAMAERILLATDFAGTLDVSGTTQAKDIIGDDVGILGFHFMRSTIEGEGPGVYAVIDCVHRGKSIALTTGARTCLVQLIKWQADNMLPVVVSIQQGEKTSRGYRPMWFGAASEVRGDASEAEDEPF